MPTHPLCSVCKQYRLWDDATKARGVCDTCRRAYGLPDEHPGAPLRPTRPCRCGHDKFVRAQVRERGASGSDYVSAYIAPLALSFRKLVKAGFFTGRKKAQNEPDLRAPIGALEAYACLSCGLVEWYARDVREVPIGPEYGTEFVDVSSAAGPFR